MKGVIEVVIFKVLGCVFAFLFGLIGLLYVYSFFIYLRELYAKRQGEKELPWCLERCETIRGEILKLSSEMDEIVSRHREKSVADEWQGYCEQLEVGTSEISPQTGLLGLIWLEHNNSVRQMELCPELRKRVDELEMCLAAENRMAAWLKEMYEPYFMGGYDNYSFWRNYCKERKAAQSEM